MARSTGRANWRGWTFKGEDFIVNVQDARMKEHVSRQRPLEAMKAFMVALQAILAVQL